MELTASQKINRFSREHLWDDEHTLAVILRVLDSASIYAQEEILNGIADAAAEEDRED